MRPMAEVLIPVLLVGYLIAAVATAGEQERTTQPCGPYDNRTPTSEELTTILTNHQAWLDSDGEPADTRRANLCQANLQGADLRNAHLQGARLFKADLQGALLRFANLQGARLFHAHLPEADLSGANLREANLDEAKLQEAVLHGADLQEANLFNARVQGADLSGANLRGANLSFANLRGAVYEPNPDPAKLPAFWTLIYPRTQLDKLVFHDSPAALVTLREAFKKGGMRTQERQLTYAIEHTKRLQAWAPLWQFLVWDPGELGGWVWDPEASEVKRRERVDERPWLEQLAGISESGFSYLCFELPSCYGMVPSRALWGLLGFIPVFALVYWLILQHAKGHSGLWMIVPADRLAPGRGKEKIVRIISRHPAKTWWKFLRHPAKTWWKFLRGESRLARTSFYFSVLSAFHLGWRELNVGTWIARMQPREYVLRATGWVRFWAGLQSLLSVYLLALWFLTYFGRPFE